MSQEAIHCCQRCLYVEDKLNRLRAYHAIEALALQAAGICKICNNGCARVIFHNIQDIAANDLRSSESPCIVISRNFEDTPFYVRMIGLEKSLYVIAIYWLTAIKPPVAADWFQTAQVAPVKPAHRGLPRISSQRPSDRANHAPQLIFEIFSGNCHFD